MKNDHDALVERLLNGSPSLVVANREMEEAAKYILALASERDRLKSYLSEGAYQTVQSEMGWKRRAESAEAELDRAIGRANWHEDRADILASVIEEIVPYLSTATPEGIRARLLRARTMSFQRPANFLDACREEEAKRK